MENSHKLALYVAYYLSRFDSEGLKHLGYGSWKAAYSDIAKRLRVNVHSVKNWRDEFDPLFGNRAGWHQRPMILSRVRVAQALEILEEPQIRGIVLDILSGKIGEDPLSEEHLLSIPSDDLSRFSGTKPFVVRGPTGKAAEEYFVEHFERTAEPKGGNLIDCRELGCGYDFRIVSDKIDYLIEVKGMGYDSGGVLFTDKEWKVADDSGERYFLCVVKNVKENPSIYFIRNPVLQLRARKNLYTVIQVSWSVSENELADKIE